MDFFCCLIILNFLLYCIYGYIVCKIGKDFIEVFYFQEKIEEEDEEGGEDD